MAFQQANSDFWFTKVPTSDGKWIKRATGTTDRAVAHAIEAMVATLRKGHHWDILGRVTRKEAPLSLDALYAMWRMTPQRKNERTGKLMLPADDERVEYVRIAMNDAVIDPLVKDFKAELLSDREQCKADTVAHYIAAVRTFMPVGSKMTAADFSTDALRKWVKGMKGVSGGTILKRGRGMARFTAWLTAENVLPLDPMQGVALPAPGDPLCHYLDRHEAIALADAQEGQYRLLSALLAGTGIEVSPALTICRRNVDKTKREIFGVGTKNDTRKRIARIADWAWPYVEEAIEGRLPDAKLFDEIPDRWVAGDKHNDAVDALAEKFPRLMECDGVEKRYTMRDQRHTWAVYAIRGGYPPDAVSKQLGHVNGVLVMKVYGRFEPKDQERAVWEERAALAATARAEAIGVRVG